jgi:hypothetical protein
MDATTPPINIHIALSVGEPVKKREMSELSDSDAMTPNTMRRIPTARRASEIALLMFFPIVNRKFPDSRTGVNNDFPASLEARREVPGGGRLNPTHEKKNDEDDQDDADDTDAAVPVAIAVAAEAAAKPTEQEDNQNDDKDESDRHDVVLSGTYDGASVL